MYIKTILRYLIPVGMAITKNIGVGKYVEERGHFQTIDGHVYNHGK